MNMYHVYNMCCDYNSVLIIIIIIYLNVIFSHLYCLFIYMLIKCVVVLYNIKVNNYNNN